MQPDSHPADVHPAPTHPEAEHVVDERAADEYAADDAETHVPSALDRLRDGLPYESTAPELILIRQKARRLTREYNEAPDGALTPRTRILASLFDLLGERPDVDAPFFCEYGRHVQVGDDFVAGPNCVFVDAGHITIGDRVRLGPGVHLYAVARPLDPAKRARGLEQGAPISIGDDVWIGGASVVNPGVTIGPGTTIGPGSVVLNDIPAGVFASGNPCRVVREL